jgi:hypothetical protein
MTKPLTTTDILSKTNYPQLVMWAAHYGVKVRLIDRMPVVGEKLLRERVLRAIDGLKEWDCWNGEETRQ